MKYKTIDEVVSEGRSREDIAWAFAQGYIFIVTTESQKHYGMVRDDRPLKLFIKYGRQPEKLMKATYFKLSRRMTMYGKRVEYSRAGIYHRFVVHVAEGETQVIEDTPLEVAERAAMMIAQNAAEPGRRSNLKRQQVAGIITVNREEIDYLLFLCQTLTDTAVGMRATLQKKLLQAKKKGEEKFNGYANIDKIIYGSHCLVDNIEQGGE